MAVQNPGVSFLLVRDKIKYITLGFSMFSAIDLS
jgi:hypothetical protein